MNDPHVLPGPLGDERGLAGPDRLQVHQIGANAQRERAGVDEPGRGFSPRVGVGWDPFGDGRTAIKAAGGIFYGSISGNEWNTMTNFQPWSTRLNFTNTGRGVNAAGVPQGATLSNPYNNFPGGTPFPYQGTYTNGGSMFGVDQDFDWAYAYQTNVGIQREITKLLGVGAAYIGTFNRKLPLGRDVNYPVASATATSVGTNVLARRPNPAFGQVLMLDSDQASDYNSLQLTFNMRKWHNVSANGYYTLSRTMSSGQLHNNTTQGGAQNFTKLEDESGRADTDQRHVFSASFNWEIDYYHGDSGLLRGLLNGWRVAPIIKLRSGLPFSITNGNVDANLDGQTATDRAQQGGKPAIDNPTPAQWFNTAAFVQNPVINGNPVDGNSKRNLLEGPGYKVVDVAVSRNFRLPGRSTLTFRAEATNALNIVNYGLPGNTVPSGATSTTFGVIRTANPMRRPQIGARLTF